MERAWKELSLSSPSDGLLIQKVESRLQAATSGFHSRLVFVLVISRIYFLHQDLQGFGVGCSILEFRLVSATLRCQHTQDFPTIFTL